jgi:hypothetical protein
VVEALATAALQPLQGNRRNRKGESLLGLCLPAIARVDRGLADQLLARLPASRADRVRDQMRSLEKASLDQLVTWPNVGGTPARQDD